MRTLLRRLRYFLRQRQIEADLAEEMDAHRAMKQQELETQGVEAAEARLAARRALGSLALAHDQSRDVWIRPWLQDIVQDVRFSARLLTKDRAFAVVAVLALGLGIGVNNTLFTIVNAICIRGLPIDRPDRVLYLGGRDIRDRDLALSYRDFVDTRSAAHTFEGLAAFAGAPLPVGDEGRAPDRVLGAYISWNALQLVRQRPLLGRDFLAADDQPGARAVVILGHDLWKTRYGGDPAVIGRTITVNGSSSVVIGVMPNRFKFPNNADLWQPLAAMPGLMSASRGARALGVFGRLSDGVTLLQARTELTAIGTRLSHDYPETNAGVRQTAVPINDRFNGRITDLVWIEFMTVGALVVIIACANVANLLLMRSTHRAHEIAVRASLGASRLRVIRQLLVESAVLAVCGSALGFWLSLLGLRVFLSAISDGGLPYWVELTMDRRVFGVLAGVGVGTVFAFGVVPALHLAKTDVHAVLKEAGRAGVGLRARRWTAAFLTAQVALSMVLLSGVVVGFRGFLAIQRADLPIDTARLLTMSVALPAQKYSTGEARLAFYGRLSDRLAGIAPVASATIASSLPIGGAAARQLTIDGRPPLTTEPLPTVWTVAVGGNYFETLGLKLHEGRSFSDTDGTAGHETAIVNRRFADMYLAKDQSVGRRVRLTDANAPAASPWLTIVGVSPSIRQRAVGLEPDPVVYVPLRSAPPSTAAVIVRAGPEPVALTPLLREEVRALDADLPVFRIRTMDQVVSESRWNPRVSQGLMTVIAIIGLLLSAVGLYAVNAYAVVQRTREIGIRMALGANRTHVLWLVLRRALFQLAFGLAFGFMGAILWDRRWETPAAPSALRFWMTDPVVLIPVAALLTAVAVAAGFFPAWRAARVNPTVALRYE